MIAGRRSASPRTRAGLLNAVRDRLSKRSTGDVTPETPTDGETRPPLEHYDRLDERELVVGLPRRSQAKLGEIESYERAHRGRPAVLNKLRYLRQDEPLPNYDKLGLAELAAALEAADADTLRRVRTYESKLRRRPEVLAQLTRMGARAAEQSRLRHQGAGHDA